MFCRYCGDSHEGHEQFCGSCGKPTAPQTPVAPPRPPAASPPAAPPPPAAQRTASLQGTVPSHMVMAVLSTLLCCMPLGVMSIVNAAKVSGRLAAGDLAGAAAASRKAKFWWVLAMILGLLVLGVAIAAQILLELDAGGY